MLDQLPADIIGLILGMTDTSTNISIRWVNTTLSVHAQLPPTGDVILHHPKLLLNGSLLVAIACIDNHMNIYHWLKSCGYQLTPYGVVLIGAYGLQPTIRTYLHLGWLMVGAAFGNHSAMYQEYSKLSHSDRHLQLIPRAIVAGNSYQLLFKCCGHAMVYDVLSECVNTRNLSSVRYWCQNYPVPYIDLGILNITQPYDIYPVAEILYQYRANIHYPTSILVQDIRYLNICGSGPLMRDINSFIQYDT